MNKAIFVVSLHRMIRMSAIIALALASFSITTRAESGGKVCNAHEEDTLYTIGYAHLDTQWRWTFQDTIYNYVANTMRDNFKLFEKYPGYRFNFTGSKRYLMMEEYYPEDYEKLKEYVAEGKWFVSGASVDENDANVPSTESLLRNILYGNLFFKNEFGKISEDYMLPDCFGFPAFMPSVLAHAGIKGFSTQKLTWHSAVGIPFNVGVWVGPDGRSVMAALNPGAYVSNLTGDLSYDKHWLERVQDMGERTGFHADFKYFGTGDVGGAPNEESVKWLQKSLESDGPLCVDAAQSDDIFQDATEEEIEKMERYKGDMLLVEHSAGSLTSQAYVKRWNRKNELLAEDAERASLIADWLGAIPYPTKRIRDNWYIILGSQMHDILPGTSVPKAYEYSWNDAVMALNGSAGVIDSAVGAAAIGLDTNVQGTPVVIYNPLSTDREDPVVAEIEFEGGAPDAVRVFDPSGEEAPSQVIEKGDSSLKVLFLASVPSVGYAVYDVRKADKPCEIETGLKVTENSLENGRFRVTIDENGDVSSVFDKQAEREVLSGPARLEFMKDSPRNYPAWNIDWDDWKLPPRAAVKGPVKARILEDGPARVAVEITREMEGSTFVQRVRLSAGDAGNRIEFDTSIDWRTQETCLKAAFPLTVSNKNASYNLELGVIERETNHSKKYEVPSHQWFDLTDEDGSYGMTVMEDSKYASDKPSENTVRLTLLRTPGCNNYCDQSTQDLGKHEILYAIAPHEGDWRDGNSHWQAMRINQPLVAFNAARHDGALGGTFSFIRVSSPQVAIRAAKMAEESDEIIVRLQELSGEPAPGVKVEFAAPIVSAREVDGQEREIGPAGIQDGKLIVGMDPFYMRAFAVKIAEPEVTVARPVSTPLQLDYNLAAMTHHKEKEEKGFDGNGNSYSADMVPAELTADGIDFKLGEGGAGKLNAVACMGQEIDLPSGGADRVYILASASGGDVDGVFESGGQKTVLNVQEWTGYVGQWDNRIWKDDRHIHGLKPAFTKRAKIAWYASHYHNGYGRKLAYNYSYMFKYGIDVPEGASSIKLPDDDRIKIFAATAVTGDVESVSPAQLLYDDFDREEDAPFFSPAEGSYDDTISVKVHFPWYSMYDELRYTTDGGDVTPESPLYTSPLVLSQDTTVKARAYGADGREGLMNTAVYTVDDVTPPSPVEVTAFDLAPVAMVTFSENVSAESAEKAGNYRISPGVKVKSAVLGVDGATVKLELSSIPSSTEDYTLTVSNISDVSSSANTIEEPVSFDYKAAGPALDVKIKTKDINYSLGVPGVSRDSVSGSPKAVGGPFGLAARLMGDGDCIVISNRPGLNPTSEITLSAWVRARTWEGNRRIMQKGNADNQYRLMSHNGQLMFDIAGVGILMSELPEAGKWHHVAATYDGIVMRIYIDAEIVAEKFTSGDMSITGDPLHIGTKHTNAAPEDFFMGDIDKITVWEHALAPEHIAVLAER